MNREARQKTARGPEPVQRIELDDSHPVVRLVLVIGLLMLGLLLIGRGIENVLTPPSDWTEIEPASAERNCSGDFVFLYNLGQSGMSASSEKKKLTILYSEACEKAVGIFSAVGVEELEGGLRQLNLHPNEDRAVEPALYRALEDVLASGSRYPYLAPVFEQYGTLFACASDAEAVNFLPGTNPDLAEYYAEVLPFINDPEAVRVILNPGGTARLAVSEEYLAYAAKNGIEIFFDFYALKNAFIADYLADSIREAGFRRGAISSYDGFVRCFDDSGEGYLLNVYELKDGHAVQTGATEYTGPMSIAVLRAFPVMEAKEHYWYRFEDGSVITALINPVTGRFEPKEDSITRMDSTESCGLTALRAYGEIA